MRRCDQATHVGAQPDETLRRGDTLAGQSEVEVGGKGVRAGRMLPVLQEVLCASRVVRMPFGQVDLRDIGDGAGGGGGHLVGSWARGPVRWVFGGAHSYRGQRSVVASAGAEFRLQSGIGSFYAEGERGSDWGMLASLGEDGTIE